MKDNLTNSLPASITTVFCFLLASITGSLALPSLASAQEPARWYQIEVSIFTNENSDLTLERWPVARMNLGFPQNTRHLSSLMDVFNLDDWSLVNPPLPSSISQNTGVDLEPTALPARSAGPAPFQSSDFRLPDFERDAFLSLPASAHNFTDTNRALNNSPNYRMLYHQAWRQPVLQSVQAIPIAMQAGRQFGERHELEGSLTIRFNPSQDRVVLDTHMWLSQFSTFPDDSGENLQLPALPENLRPALTALPSGAEEVATFPVYYPTQIIPIRGSRDMRSNEFHYVDHPALGIVVQVFPYTPPPAPVMNIQDDQLPL